MRKQVILASFLTTGCLANFDPFKEADFLNDYSTNVCNILADCDDQVADQSYDSAYADQVLATCESYVWDPNNKGCTIQVNAAKTCYEESQAIYDEVYETQDCSQLQDWVNTPGKACNVTYINCVTDKPFGSLPLGGSAWN